MGSIAVKESILANLYFTRIYIALLIVFLAYWLYYRLRMCGQLKLYYAQCSSNAYIVENASKLSKSVYKPTPFLLEGNLQTIYAEIVNKRTKGRHGFEFQRQLVMTEDGGQIALDWVISDDRHAASPIIAIFPGLTGGSDNSYIGHICRSALAQGYRCVVLNKRGCSNTPLLVTAGCR
eukprot:TRINITY_DN6791_c0_g1_i3.p2 TRINITY_DN6791_c0_g1~~TRINITY_DN6791_c0_g1_i3.p2  ORF type:complete len:178 (+),score=32.11 TRINITY_DN6791_c0_g1_i3:180-713(+)